MLDEASRAFLESLTDLEPDDRALLIHKCQEEKVYTMDDLLRVTRDDLRDWGLTTGPRNFVLAKLREKVPAEMHFALTPAIPNPTPQPNPVEPSLIARLDELLKRARDFCAENRFSFYHFGAKVLETKSRGTISDLFTGKAPRQNDTAQRYIRRIEQFFSLDDLERKQLFQMDVVPQRRRVFLSPNQRATLDPMIKAKQPFPLKEKEQLVSLFRTIDPSKDINVGTITNYIKNQRSKNRKQQQQQLEAQGHHHPAAVGLQVADMPSSLDL